MIENKHWYQFEEDLEADSPQIEEEPIEQQKQWILGFLERTFVSFLIVMIMAYCTNSNMPGAQWAREYWHIAICASARQTFGKIIKSPLINSIVANCRNLIRLEDVTQGLIKEQSLPASGALSNWVWPVRGRVVRGYGWYTPSGSNEPQFSNGIEIGAVLEEKVSAINSGKIIKISKGRESGWDLIINHGGGWKSTYRNLGELYVELNQYIQAGEVIAKLKRTGEPVLKLEISEAGKPINPLSLLVNI